MWKNLLNEGSVLPSTKQITPSDRSDSNEGIGDRSEIGAEPASGQKKIWGDLDKNGKGFEGKFDTQGGSCTRMFASNTDAPKSTSGMRALKESAAGEDTGVMSGRHKPSAAAAPASPTICDVKGADTIHGGSDNNMDKKSKKNVVTESEILGATVAVVSSKLLTEMYQLNKFKK